MHICEGCKKQIKDSDLKSIDSFRIQLCCNGYSLRFIPDDSEKCLKCLALIRLGTYKPDILKILDECDCTALLKSSW